MTLAVVMNTKNMAQTVGSALSSVQDLADEVIVVDMQSTDRTVDIAKEHGATVYSYQDDVGVVEPARNFALAQAHSDWILVLDADEEVLPGLADRIRQIVHEPASTPPAATAYALPRLNRLFGRALQHTRWWPDRQIRLFRAGSVRWSDTVHQPPQVTGTLIELPANEAVALLHHNYQTVEQYLERLNRYTTIAQKQTTTPPPPLTATGCVHAFSDEFCDRFFAGEGYRDGLHGLALSLMQSCYQLTLALKHWQKAGFPDTTTADDAMTAVAQLEHHLTYWRATSHIKQGGISSLVWRARRWWLQHVSTLGVRNTK